MRYTIRIHLCFLLFLTLEMSTQCLIQHPILIDLVIILGHQLSTTKSRRSLCLFYSYCSHRGVKTFHLFLKV